MEYRTESGSWLANTGTASWSIIVASVLLMTATCGPCDPIQEEPADIAGPIDAASDGGASDTLSPGDTADAAVGDTADASIPPLGLCSPEPSHYPPRPTWSEFDKGHPDYKNVMNNFNALDSLRLLGSMLLKVFKALEDVGNLGAEDTGYCICNCPNENADWAGLPDNPNAIPAWADNQTTIFQNQCYAVDLPRSNCNNQCQNRPDFGNVPEIEDDPQSLWIREDVFETPKKESKFSFDLMKWLDRILSLFNSSGNACSVGNTANCADGEVCHSGTCKSKLRKVLDTMSSVGANLTQAVEDVIQALNDFETFINRFTEGYHLGGYSEQRPDLHMCVGWAGHGVFAQMANLGGDKFSIGSRYSSHNLSWDHRAQYRSGGFGVQAFGKSLSLLPTPELNAQIDARRVWNTDKPFGIQMPSGGISLSQIENYDIFSLVDSNQITELASADGDPSTITVGELLVDGFFPADYTSNSDGNTYTWPRSEADAPAPWLSWQGWEGEDKSTAVLSAGLNLPLAIEPIRKDLPTIPIFPPYASIQPYFSLGAGVEWIHEADRLLERIRDKINQNLPSAEQLEDSDFEREMHAMQAPDLTGDDGTTAYVQPELGADLMFGLQLSSFAHIGVTASLGIGARVEPGGWGGIVDLNYALVETLRNSNPPPDADCEPVWNVDSTQTCSNRTWDASEADYACSTDGTSSCCFGIGDKSACIDSWTGIDQAFCEQLGEIGKTSGNHNEALSWLDNLGDFVDASTIQQLESELGEGVELSSQWNEGATCEEAACDTNLDPIELDSLAECQEHGYCIGPDDEILAHDITQNACENANVDGETGRCCWNYSGDDGGGGSYKNISCGLSRDTCEDANNGVYMPGGLCGGNVDRSDCSSRTDDRIGAGDTTFVPYQCTTQFQPEVTDWKGPGCHPLNDGFPSACGCSSDTDCAGSETCNADGLCEENAGYSCTCDPSDSNSCSSGRSCRDGACFKECGTDADCRSGLVCDGDNLCTPEHDIPTAEQVVWGMKNGTAPLHAVSTYSYSELLFWAYAIFGIDIGLGIKLFGSTKELTLWEFSKLADLGSTRKGWYQPGLEARYQHDCAEPAGQVVSNRQPEPITQADGVNISDHGALSGHVDRYPDPIPGNIDPEQDGNACHPSGNPNACSWEEFVGWCEDELPNNVTDPDAPSNDDIAGGLEDTADWGEEVGLEIWTAGQQCIDGEPWYEWAQNANGSLESQQCIYDDGQNQTVFACENAGHVLLDQFGCLDTNLSSNASTLANAFGSQITTNGGAQFDLSELLIDPNAPLSTENVHPTYLFSPFGPSGLAGYFWVDDAEQCYDQTYAQESRCECSVDADCDTEAGETCGPGGYCRTDSGNLAACPVIGLADEPEVEPCCGDSQIQPGEECDDGNTEPGDECSSYCTVEEGGGDETGACCRDFQCVQTTEQRCKDTEGTFQQGASCEEVECETASTGACCSGDLCTDRVAATDCPSGDFKFYEGAQCGEIDACGNISSGACCEGDTCREVAPHECSSTAHYHAGQTCPEVPCK